MKNKPNPKDFVFSNKTGETLLRKPGDIRGYDFVIDTLKDCTIYLLDRSAQITVDNCTGCTFFIGPVDGSLFLRDCADCKVSVCCQQLRTKNCHRVSFNVFCSSDPSIEYSDELQFGPYNFAYPKLDEHFSAAQLQSEEDHWSQIFDFNQEDGARHWKLQDPTTFKLLEYPLEGFDSPVNPVPIHLKYGGTLTGPIPLGSQQQLGAEDAGGMLAFDIDTSQTKAQSLYTQLGSQPPPSSDPFADFPESSQSKKPDLKSMDPFEQSHEDLFAAPLTKPGALPQGLNRQDPFSTAPPQDLNKQAPFSVPPPQDVTRQAPFSVPQTQDVTRTDPFSLHQSQDLSSGFQGRQDPFAGPPTAQTDFFQEASEEPQQKYDAFQEEASPVEEEEELDEDTKERLRARERAYQEHMKALYEKEEAERSAKSDRRAQASEELRRWKEERARQTDQRKQYNRQQEDSFLQARKAYKEGAPWKKVSSMIDYKENSDRKDLARMRQVLLAKKNE